MSYILNEPFSITNFQNWKFFGQWAGEGLQIKIKDRNNSLYFNLSDVQYVWSSHVKVSKKDPEKTLQRELKYLLPDENTLGFEVCKRRFEGKEIVFIVFGKYQQQTDRLTAGGMIFGIGCALAASGVGLPAAMVLGFGGSGFMDAWKKDGLDFNLNENLKQGLVGAATGLVTGGFQLLKPFAGWGVSLAAKAVESASSGLLGYVTSATLNGEKVTPKGAATAILTSAVVPIASTKAGNLIPLDQIDDVATSILVKSAVEGGAGSAASQMVRNGLDRKPLLNDLGISIIQGGLTAAAYSFPKAVEAAEAAEKQKINKQADLQELKDLEEQKKIALEEQKTKELEGQKKIDLKEQEIKEIEQKIAALEERIMQADQKRQTEVQKQTQDIESERKELSGLRKNREEAVQELNRHISHRENVIRDSVGSNIGRRIRQGWQVYLDGKWEKVPKSQEGEYVNNFIKRIADGESLTFRKAGHDDKIYSLDTKGLDERYSKVSEWNDRIQKKVDSINELKLTSDVSRKSFFNEQRQMAIDNRDNHIANREQIARKAYERSIGECIKHGWWVHVDNKWEKVPKSQKNEYVEIFVKKVANGEAVTFKKSGWDNKVFQFESNEYLNKCNQRISLFDNKINNFQENPSPQQNSANKDQGPSLGDLKVLLNAVMQEKSIPTFSEKDSSVPLPEQKNEGLEKPIYEENPFLSPPLRSKNKPPQIVPLPLQDPILSTSSSSSSSKDVEELQAANDPLALGHEESLLSETSEGVPGVAETELPQPAFQQQENDDQAIQMARRQAELAHQRKLEKEKILGQISKLSAQKAILENEVRRCRSNLLKRSKQAKITELERQISDLWNRMN